MIVADPRILSDEWMVIGRQENTPFGGRIDLLAIAPDASLVLVELKIAIEQPREIVAQAIDYAAWVADLSKEKIVQIYQRFSQGGNLSDAFHQHYGEALDEDTLNESHQIILVAAELDDATERIIGYLNARDIAINVIFFQVFEHEGVQILSRAWLIDPTETQANVTTAKTPKGEREPWNGGSMPPSARARDGTGRTLGSLGVSSPPAVEPGIARRSNCFRRTIECGSRFRAPGMSVFVG